MTRTGLAGHWMVIGAVLMGGAAGPGCTDDDDPTGNAGGKGGSADASSTNNRDTLPPASDSGAAGAGGSDASIPPDAQGADTVPAPDAGPGMPAGFTEVVWAKTQALAGLPALPPDPTNRFADDAKAATLGQRLFFDKSYSGALAVAGTADNGGVGAVGEQGKLSCAGCHNSPALDDRRSKPGNVSLGADFLGRNSPPLVNAAYYKWVNWAGRFSTQWELPIAVAENPKNMNSDRLRIAHRIFNKYKADYEAIFGTLDPAIGADAARFPASGKPKAMGAIDGPWEMMTDADRLIVNTVFVNYAKALQAYMRKLTVRASRFDRFVAGQFDALTADEKEGVKLFVSSKTNCVTCHGGPRFTDDDFHNLGVPQTGDHVPTADNGRFADVPPLLASSFTSAGNFSDDKAAGMARLAGLVNPAPDSTKGQFRTPSLRNVGQTAPYMHAGQLATLEDVISFYDKADATPAVGTKDPALKPLGLTATEKAQLVAFLKALDTDAVPAALLVDTSAP